MESVLNHLLEANRCLQAGQLAQAESLFMREIERDPTNASVMHQLGVLAHQRGDGVEAVAFLRRAVAAAPGNDLFANNLGVLLEQQGDLIEALACYEAALALNPERAGVHFNRANTQRALGREAEAREGFRDAIQCDENHASALHNLAVLLKENGEREEAEPLFRRSIALDPQNVDAHVNLGALLQSLGRLEESLACYRAAAQLQPESPEAAAGEATILEQRGEVDAACERLLPVMRHSSAHPDVATIFASLARRLQREDEALELLTRIAERTDLVREKMQAVLFALGRLHDALGHFEKAFHSYERGNQLHLHAFDSATFHAFADSVMSTFSATFLRKAPRAKSGSELPIFVVGMPRSGTSLVEQILATHPAVFGAGELAEIELLALALPGRYPECIPTITQDALDVAAARYLSTLRQLAPDAARVVDKMPGNFMHLGFIELLFPKARVVHIQRDPLDTCLSCYFQNFNNGHEYSSDLTQLGEVYRAYERVMAHWRKVARVPLLEVRYEDLVHHQERETRRLLDFCGLSWDAACLSFHKTRREVRTASYDQVRQPLYQSSAGRHVNYAAFLAPLRTALG